MSRIYISESGSDRNDGLTKQTAIYSWKRARKLFTGHMEISVDNAFTRRRLMKELEASRGQLLARAFRAGLGT
jgi:hypothetical protein